MGLDNIIYLNSNRECLTQEIFDDFINQQINLMEIDKDFAIKNSLYLSFRGKAYFDFVYSVTECSIFNDIDKDASLEIFNDLDKFISTFDDDLKHIDKILYNNDNEISYLCCDDYLLSELHNKCIAYINDKYSDDSYVMSIFDSLLGSRFDNTFYKSIYYPTYDEILSLRKLFKFIYDNDLFLYASY